MTQPKSAEARLGDRAKALASASGEQLLPQEELREVRQRINGGAARMPTFTMNAMCRI